LGERWAPNSVVEGSNPSWRAKTMKEMNEWEKREFESNIKSKTFTGTFLYNLDLLKEFFSRTSGYNGPFIKSLWLTDTDLFKYCKMVGIELEKDTSRSEYHIKTEKKSEPVLFDVEFLDIPEKT
jgi:hypothetical protein